MIIQEQEVRGLTCRVFTRRLEAPDRTLVEAAFDVDAEHSRLEMLREILRKPLVYAVAFPTVDHLDVLQVFLASEPNTPDGVFACVVITPSHMRSRLESEPVIVEGFDLQMAAVDEMDEATLRLAVSSWANRVSPDLAIARIEVIPWEQPDPETVVLCGAATTRTDGANCNRPSSPKHGGRCWQHRDRLKLTAAINSLKKLAAERRAIASLKKLADRWPPNLWIFADGGSLNIMRLNATGERAYTAEGGADIDYRVGEVDIPNDGGGW